MPLSDRIIRGEAAKKLSNVEFTTVGHRANNPVERLYSDLGTLFPAESKPVELSETEKRLRDWEMHLKQREQAIAELERKTLEQATETGHQRGYEAGWDAAHYERTVLIQVASSLQEQFQKFQTELGDKVLDLACLVAGKILGDSVEQNLSQASAALHEIIHSMALKPDNLTLLAHPQTLEALKAQFGDESELSNIKLRADSNLMTGGFVLQHPEGQVDASMETRWKRTIESLGRKIPLNLPNEEASDE